MSTFNMEEADNYGGNGTGSFFSLKDDKDSAKVRFLYNSVEDVKGYAVHRIEVGEDKFRYVNCLRSYNEPIEKCPLCAAGSKVVPRLFLKLYNEDAKEYQIWERGKTYFSKIASLSGHYNPLCNEIIEIERSGKKGDKQTSYQFYPIENSPVNLDDYEGSEPLGTIILDMTNEQMEHYIETGELPESNNTGDSKQQETERRTPVNNQPTNQPRRRVF